MSKSKKNNELNLVRSVNKNVRSSTRKLKPILKALVGKKVDYALRDLEFSNKRICGDVKKTLASAIANAENNYQYDIDKLIVKEAYCINFLYNSYDTLQTDLLKPYLLFN